MVSPRLHRSCIHRSRAELHRRLWLFWKSRCFPGSFIGSPSLLFCFLPRSPGKNWMIIQVGTCLHNLALSFPISITKERQISFPKAKSVWMISMAPWYESSELKPTARVTETSSWSCSKSLWESDPKAKKREIHSCCNRGAWKQQRIQHFSRIWYVDRLRVFIYKIYQTSEVIICKAPSPKIWAWVRCLPFLSKNNVGHKEGEVNLELILQNAGANANGKQAFPNTSCRTEVESLSTLCEQ